MLRFGATLLTVCMSTLTAAAGFGADPPTSQPAGETTGGLVGELQREHELLWQQALVTYRDLDTQARKAVIGHDFTQARRLAQEARFVVERNRRFADTPAAYEAQLDEARGLGEYVETESRVWEEQVAHLKQQQIIDQERHRLTAIADQTHRKVTLLKNQADELAKEQKYEEAIQILKQVVAIDPTDESAQWKKQVLEDFFKAATIRSNHKVKEAETVSLLGDNIEAAIPWHQDILYPKNWREISARRVSASEESEDERSRDVRRKLTETAPEINWEEMPFEQVITYLGDVTGQNIVANWTALSAAGVEKDKAVSLKLKAGSVPLSKVLDQVLELVGGGETALAYEIADGVVTISTKEDLDRRTLLHVYDVNDLLIDVPDFAGMNLNLQNIGQNGGQGGLGGGGQGGGGGGGQGIFGGQGQGGGPNGQQRPPRPPVDVDNLIELIQETIDPESWRQSGGTIGSVRPLRNQLIVTQTSNAHKQLVDLLTQLRKAHAIQVAVEARFITVTRNYLEQIGVDLDVVLNNGNAGFDRGGFANSPLVDPATGANVLVPRQFSRLGFTPGAPGGLGLNIPTQGFPEPFGQPGLIPQPGNFGPHSSHFTPIPIQNNTLNLAAPVATNIPGSLGGDQTQPAMNLFGSFLDNMQVDFLLRATQVDARSSDLDSPRIVLFNGQRSTFSAFIEQDYVASLTPVVGNNVGLFQPVIQTALSGRQLDVQATVSADRRYVTMTVRTFTQVTGDPVPFQFTTGSTTGGAGFLQLVRRTTNSVNTTVTVPDGGTLLIGGLKQAAERERDAGVPILSRIPVLKRAFSNTSLVKDDQVLLILIKPKIIIQDEAEQDAFPTLTKR